MTKKQMARWDKQWRRAKGQVRSKRWRKKHPGIMAFAELLTSVMRMPKVKWFKVGGDKP